MKTTLSDYVCPCCSETFDVEIIPFVPARNMNGRVEDAIPEEGGYTDPAECPKCREEVDFEEANK